jgi:hypothetical protein
LVAWKYLLWMHFLANKMYIFMLYYKACSLTNCIQVISPLRRLFVHNIKGQGSGVILLFMAKNQISTSRIVLITTDKSKLLTMVISKSSQ